MTIQRNADSEPSEEETDPGRRLGPRGVCLLALIQTDYPV